MLFEFSYKTIPLSQRWERGTGEGKKTGVNDTATDKTMWVYIK
jgi:hypothetical protein